MDTIEANAAGIDVGAESHWVAVPPGQGGGGGDVRQFNAFTEGLQELSAWLKDCGVRAVAMESTGVYWIPLFELLESDGFQVKLVDARHVKNVSGRKSDVLDCQWLQQLHAFGLLSAAFRPEEDICVLRSYLRQRAMLVSCASQHIQHMQKALTQMNLKLQHVLSDISGVSGLKILRAIVAGEHNPRVLAKLRDGRCRSTEETIVAALTGSYRREHLFALQQALELYDMYQQKIAACDTQIQTQLKRFEDRSGGVPPPSDKAQKKGGKGNAPGFDLRGSLYRMLGVDLTAIPGLDAYTVAKIVAEIGTDMSAWPTVGHFASWLGLCPGTRISGGHRLSGRVKRCANRAAQALRVSAQTLSRSKSALGALYRNIRARQGPSAANTATAHKLARLIYTLIQTREPYRDEGEAGYLQNNRTRLLRNLQRKAQALNFVLV